MKNICILGCGWLGLPLAKSLINKGFSVKGSTTSEAKLAVLEFANIRAYSIRLTENEVIGQIDDFLSESEILIIDIPPKLRGDGAENFVAKIATLIPFIAKSTINHVMFISSTSVYADDNTIVTENSQPEPDTESGRQLLATEKLLQTNTNFKTTVIRFGGLIGENRHPIHFLAGRQNLENPEAPINLIHQDDCIGIIEAVIAQKTKGEVFNAVAPYHPSRKDYYTQKAVALGLPLPEFGESKKSVGKTILSDKIANTLNYTFRNADL
ncbi:SDR family oxidoreductase [Flavobacterium sp.]|jgi:nucleoside-diphosphate-sugar epimerase|uniref:SDR family oxidoreductase n=1 Tax=Flavobacterium sp. TaxID=239 RepID=UPI0037BEB8A4